MFLNSADLSSQELNTSSPDRNGETLGALCMRVAATFGGGLVVTTLLAAVFHHI